MSITKGLDDEVEVEEEGARRLELERFMDGSAGVPVGETADRDALTTRGC